LKRSYLRGFAVLGIAAMAGAACGKDKTTTSAGAAQETTTTAAAAPAMADNQSAGLRATLTAKLQEHVFLAGIATGTALGGGSLDAPAATLDTNSVELSQAIGGLYGDAAGKQFLELWRKHIGFFVSYTTSKAKNDAAGAQKAMADLDGYRNDFGAFLASANPNLTKDAVAQSLIPHVTTLFATIDAQAAKDPSAFDKLKAAADVMPDEAKVLAGAIAKQKNLGNPDAGAPALQAGLTHLLQEHVFLAGIATNTALSGGKLDAPAAALDKNSVELSEAISSVYGDAAGKQFLELWRKHIGFFVSYTTAKAKNDAAGAQKAMADLDGYRNDFGAFLASANPNLTKDAVAQSLIPHVTTLFAAIDAQAAKDPSAFDKLKAAADVMPDEAKVLAGAIAKQYPDKFPNS
jgi:hypothetical protein